MNSSSLAAQKTITPSVRKFAFGGALLGAGFILTSLCTLVRSIVIARGITVEDFGIGSALLAVLALIEMSTAIAVDKQLLQDESGDSDEMLAGAHTMAVARGIICSLLLLAIAWPTSILLNLSELLWAFQLVAIAPLLNCFTHYEYVAMQRHSRQGPAVAITAVPEIVITLLLIPVIYLWPDFRSIIFVCLALPVARVVISHLLARRAYKLSFDRVLLMKMLRFAWPLMLSGLLLFGIFQGDRLIVGYFFDVHTLGYYSLALTFFLLPGQILHRICNSLFLSHVADAFRGQHDWQSWSGIFWNCLLFIAAAFCVFCSFIGTWLMTLVFGEKYAPAADLIPFIGLMVSLRIMRIAPSVLALALAQPGCELRANLARSIAIPLAVLIVARGHTIEAVAVAAVVGELLALVTAWISLRLPAHPTRLWQHDPRMLALSLTAICISALPILLSPSSPNLFNSAMVSACVLSFMFFLCFQRAQTLINARGASNE